MFSLKNKSDSCAVLPNTTFQSKLEKYRLTSQPLGSCRIYWESSHLNPHIIQVNSYSSTFLRHYFQMRRLLELFYLLSQAHYKKEVIFTFAAQKWNKKLQLIFIPYSMACSSTTEVWAALLLCWSEIAPLFWFWTSCWCRSLFLMRKGGRNKNHIINTPFLIWRHTSTQLFFAIFY